jgi:chitodextrinase
MNTFMNVKIQLFVLFLFISIGSFAQTVSCNGFNAWTSSQAYNTSQEVVYNGVLYQAQWYSEGITPSNTPYTAWKVVGTCSVPIVPNYISCTGIPVWSSTIAYNTGNQATFNGLLYQANWYTQNQEPDLTNAWTLLGTCITSTINVTGSLTPFTEIVGGQSPAQSLTISGTNLVGAVQVSAPANFLISLTSGSGYSNQLTLTASSGSVSGTVYVVYSPSASGTQANAIVISAPGVVSQTVSVSGTATSLWVINGINAYNSNTGNIGIGTTNPKYTLDVNGVVRIGNTAPTNYTNFSLAVAGTIVSQQNIVTAPGNWADFVFDSCYVMPTLEETEAYIEKNHHLPSVPSEKEVKANGFDLASMDATLLQKIEELYLHMIELKKQNENQVSQMQQEIDTLKKQIKILEQK